LPTLTQSAKRLKALNQPRQKKPPNPTEGGGPSQN
jgi:hypothetical protein